MSGSVRAATQRVRELKYALLAQGVALSDEARARLVRRGGGELVYREYATTGGLTLKSGDLYINAPVDEWYCEVPEATLRFADGGFLLDWRGDEIAVDVMQPPGYLGAAPAGVMTHADRIRLSPITGCACSCAFCDSPSRPYRLLGIDELLNSLSLAEADQALPASHILISGGTPRPHDEAALDACFEALIQGTSLPADVMLMPRSDNGIVERLHAWGAHGLSINLEVYDETLASELVPQKDRRGREGYADMWDRAVSIFGAGRVRSLLIVGLEPEESVLEGVEFIASHGVDPVLSPFRPAPGTRLADVRPPSAESMQRLHESSEEIARRYGVKLGPRCIPCQHNTIAFPDGTDAYVYS